MGYDSFENRMNARIDREKGDKKREDDKHIFETSPLVRAAFEKTRKIFESESISPDDFADLYDPEMIKRDKNKVAEIKTKFYEAGSAKIAADILEVIIFEQTELSNWFGQNANTVKTSEYDDIINGVDLVVEFNNEELPTTHMALGMDATYGTQAGTVGKKLKRIRDDIDHGNLSTIKYFRSSDSRYHGKLSLVPRVIVGLEKKHIIELAQLWMQGDKKALAVHPAQRLILEQTKKQLEAYMEYSFNKNKPDLERAFQQPLTIVRSILKEKAEIPLGEWKDDRVHAEILSQLSMFGQH